MYEQIKEFILDRQKQSGKTIGDLAKELGYSVSHITNYLNGNKEMSRNFLETIAEHYDMAIVYYKGVYRIVKAVGNEIVMMKGEE